MEASRYLLTGALLASLVMPAGSSAQLLAPVKGKIFNNVTNDGRTLGVVALNFDGEKLKCAIVGDPLPPDANFPLKFVHTVVCEDHSQIAFLTQGKITGILEVCSPDFVAFSFQEVSTPDLTRPTKGLFEGVTGGSLTITGKVSCQLEIDMTFQGHVLFP